MSKRTNTIQLTKEGQVLKQLRKRQCLTLYQVADKTGFSDTYISFIENGRTTPPKDEALRKLLKVYGNITAKYFYELVREFKEDDDDLLYLGKVLKHLSSEDLKLIRGIVDMRLKDSK